MNAPAPGSTPDRVYHKMVLADALARFYAERSAFWHTIDSGLKTTVAAATSLAAMSFFVQDLPWVAKTLTVLAAILSVAAVVLSPGDRSTDFAETAQKARRATNDLEVLWSEIKTLKNRAATRRLGEIIEYLEDPKTSGLVKLRPNRKRFKRSWDEAKAARGIG